MFHVFDCCTMKSPVLSGRKRGTFQRFSYGNSPEHGDMHLCMHPYIHPGTSAFFSMHMSGYERDFLQMHVWERTCPVEIHSRNRHGDAECSTFLTAAL
jgi:hypothetical protein